MNRLWALLAVSTVILAACGASTGDAGVLQLPAVEPDAQTRPSETVPDGAATRSKTGAAAGREGETVASDASPATLSTQEQARRETIVVDISLYLLVDDVNAPNPAISSHRSEDDLREILDGINEIWRQADIRFDPNFVGTLEVPEDVLSSMVRGDLRTFFNEVGNRVETPQLSAINGFYVRDVGGPNGVKPFGSAAFFVIDQPSVHDRRVSSHEIGHILGLRHASRDSDRLLFSGTNGMTLTEEEANVARYVAQGLLEGER